MTSKREIKSKLLRFNLAQAQLRFPVVGWYPPCRASKDQLPMLVVIALISSFSYALQVALMTSVYRTMDRLSANGYRGLTLAITMFPLLFFVPRSDFMNTSQWTAEVAIAALLGVLGNLSASRAYSFLPVGIASATFVSFRAVVAAGIGVIVLRESLSIWQWLSAGALLGGVLVLGLSRSHGVLPAEYDVRRGFLASLTAGLLLGVAFWIVGNSSRRVHPFLIGYSWEVSIGVLSLGIASIRSLLNGIGRERISLRQFGTILVFGAPTALGTGCYAYAATLGPITIVVALLSTIMMFSTLLATFLYHERLSPPQWAIMVFICLTLIVLKLLSA